ncbi:unnamed protein product [Rotaria socialis]|uniref:Uncharacterized protein n=1 Tax=Rotaria socialis TaxID=392032 RepID=A0A819ZB84_9BILA|nr:unnamed protein product [Rotaria socialis]CAF3337651.1 unnamed protein product [Rotaria socialis]CAF3459380.1 unnamed protein product [Rotaria socialis]CAF3517724.1 unnamed protein product [Rotaria socialis]CAF4108754.1 unnamed protein product [Rotaria socialis]
MSTFLTPLVIPTIPANATWSKNGTAIVGIKGKGSSTQQLKEPFGLFVDDDDDQILVIADWGNHRIMQWKKGDTDGQLVAGSNVKGNQLDQLDRPDDVLIDKETDSLIICDRWNHRVVRWSRRTGTTQGEILIDNITCYGLAMDDQRYLYVSETEENKVRRYKLADKNETLVAVGSGTINGLNELNEPHYLFVDRQQNVYVSDGLNHRVMKWTKGAKESFIVAGGQGQGNNLTQLNEPNGLFVDTLGTVYVADSNNHRIMRWAQGEKQGTVIAGGNGQGREAYQLNNPIGLSFDRQGNLYIVDDNNHRVQLFSLEKTRVN